MERIREIFGQNVRKYRRARSWSQAELAEKLDVSDAFVAHIERGSRGASLETIEMLAHCLEIPYTALFEEQTEEDTDYAHILLSLEVELKKKICKEIETCIKEALLM